jgi:outer membrane protein assembly factor BamD
MRKAALFLGLATALGFGSGCSGSDSGEHGVTYQVTAKQNYERGLKELKDENFPEAMKYFTFLKQKFPFSKYAVLAELRLADTQFERGHYLEAIDQYKLFGRSHPTHEFVEDGYIGFKICESYYKQIPEDFFLLPPAFEKDQSATKDALREMDSFIERWPKSKYLDKAKAMRLQAMQSLAASELYVARFYSSKNKWRATAWRLEGMLKNYGGTQYDVEGLWLLGLAYEKLSEPEKARETWGKLLKEHPTAKESAKAQAQLQHLPAPKSPIPTVPERRPEGVKPEPKPEQPEKPAQPNPPEGTPAPESPES